MYFKNRNLFIKVITVRVMHVQEKSRFEESEVRIIMPNKDNLYSKNRSFFIKVITVHLKPTIHCATKLHATNCNKAVTKLKQSCNTLVTTLLQFVACNFVA